MPDRKRMWLSSLIQNVRHPGALTAEQQAQQQHQADILSFLGHTGEGVTALLRPPEEDKARMVVIRLRPLNPTLPPQYFDADIRAVQTLKTKGLDPILNARVQTVQKQLAHALSRE
jgi:hypothetical protein